MKGAIDTGKLRPNQGRTNQKLFFAKLQLDLLIKTVEAKAEFTWEAFALSAREACVMHLHGALLAFLQELVRFYKLQSPIFSTEQLRVLMAAKGQVSPEAAILQQLQAQPESWLAQLFKAYDECLIASDRPEVEWQEEVESAGVISLKTVHHDLPLSPGDIASLQLWQQELTQIIRDFRREMTEY